MKIVNRVHEKTFLLVFNCKLFIIYTYVLFVKKTSKLFWVLFAFSWFSTISLTKQTRYPELDALHEIGGWNNFSAVFNAK